MNLDLQQRIARVEEIKLHWAARQSDLWEEIEKTEKILAILKNEHDKASISLIRANNELDRLNNIA